MRLCLSLLFAPALFTTTSVSAGVVLSDSALDSVVMGVPGLASFSKIADFDDEPADSANDTTDATTTESELSPLTMEAHLPTQEAEAEAEPEAGILGNQGWPRML